MIRIGRDRCASFLLEDFFRAARIALLVMDASESRENFRVAPM